MSNVASEVEEYDNVPELSVSTGHRPVSGGHGDQVSTGEWNEEKRGSAEGAGTEPLLEKNGKTESSSGGQKPKRFSWGKKKKNSLKTDPGLFQAVLYIFTLYVCVCDVRACLCMYIYIRRSFKFFYGNNEIQTIFFLCFKT